MKCIFIYNPVGGNGKIAKKLNIIVKGLKEKYDEVDVSESKGAGDMKRIAHDAVGKYDAIVFAGGDGSFNEVVQGIAEFDELPELGYIPSGTVNDVAHTFKIPKNVKKAIRVIQTGRTEKVDCMKVNDKYAFYVVAAGAFTSATYMTPQIQKRHLGKFAYGVEGIKHNLNFQLFDVACKCEEKENYFKDCVLITFMNGRYVAGFGLNRKNSLQDGKIEVAIIRRKKKPTLLKKLGGIFSIAWLFLFGYRSKYKGIIRLEGSHFDVNVGEDVVWNFDGERGENGKIHIEVIPKKINLIMPKNAKIS